MKVLGVGLPKTGTTSLHKAFGILGINSIHCPLSWDSMIQYEAATDSPCVLWYRRVHQEFPFCRFVYTMREIDSWIESSRNHYARRAPAIEYLKFRRWIFHRDTFDEAQWKKVYHAHQREVESYCEIHSVQLLHLPIDQRPTWGPLCEFLGVAVPTEPFPHENATVYCPPRPQQG